jgi:hypothetical protein
MEQRGFRGAILRGSGLFFPRFAAEWDAGEGSPGGLVVDFSVFLIGNCSTYCRHRTVVAEKHRGSAWLKWGELTRGTGTPL